MEIKTQKHYFDGYTLVEMIVSLSVLVLIMGIVLVGLQEVRQTSLVRDSAQQVAAQISQAIQDTKNGIKADSCTSLRLDVPRECSNYFIAVDGNIVSGVRDLRTYRKFVQTTDCDAYDLNNRCVGNITNLSSFPIPPADQILALGGTQFAGAGTLGLVFSTQSFPLVQLSPGGSFIFDPANPDAVRIVIQSQINPDIQKTVCVYKNGAVLVKNGSCT